ncbi:MAG: ferritin family protein [Candidatus Omnitrophica bacterium]|nr:ferritin family protein [Candidatus Omnitrophota bacterium]
MKFDESDPVSALQYALKQEIQAIHDYTESAKSVKHEATRRMFEMLAEEEKKHKALIEEILDKDFYREG